MGYFMVFAKKVAFWKRGPEFEKNIWYSNNIWYLSNSNQIQIWFLGFFEYQIKFKYDFEEKFTSLTQSFWVRMTWAEKEHESRPVIHGRFEDLNRNKRFLTRIWVKRWYIRCGWVATREFIKFKSNTNMIFGIFQISNKIQMWFLRFFKYQIKFKYDFRNFFELCCCQ